MLDPIIHFLGGVLSIAYAVVPNVGLAILVLTILANLAMFPLTLKQTRSTKAMQEIQPIVKDLQKQYKGDRQKLNEEMVALYKERGVNPASGCLPMLVQMPIWWSLFRLLRSFRVAGAIDPTRFLPEGSKLSAAILDGRTTFLPGMDVATSPSEAAQNGLSRALPYLVVVVFIVVTGYYQQRQLSRWRETGRTGQTTPQQSQVQSLTKAMPILFGLISYGLLLGVDLYIAAGQVIRIALQGWIRRIEPPDEEPPGGAET